jgi:prepilin-type N-terminal cleavage/methylation domain-containing protein
MARSARGFTLLEMVLVIVLLGVGTIGVLSMFGQVAKSLPASRDVQAAAQGAQACAEYILGARRSGQVAVADIDATICNVLPAVSGFSRSVAVSDVSAGAACPDSAAGTCVQAVVTVASADVTSSVTLMVVNY